MPQNVLITGTGRPWGLGFNLGNAVKYISRAGKKDPDKYIEDLQKAVWYLNSSKAKHSTF